MTIVSHFFVVNSSHYKHYLSTGIQVILKVFTDIIHSLYNLKYQIIKYKNRLKAYTKSFQKSVFLLLI